MLARPLALFGSAHSASASLAAAVAIGSAAAASLAGFPGGVGRILADYRGCVRPGRDREQGSRPRVVAVSAAVAERQAAGVAFAPATDLCARTASGFAA